MPEPPIWSGQSLAGDTLAAVVRAGPDWHLDVKWGKGRCRVPVSLLGDFLILHADRRFVCHDAGEFHGAVERTLGKNEAAARSALWALSRDGRLIDVSLLAILVRDAKLWSPDNRSESREPLPIESDAILNSFDELVEQAREITNGTETAHLANRFGILGLTVEVQARVAAYHVARQGLILDVGARERLQLACLGRRDELLQYLRRDSSWSKILKSEGKEPRLDEKGFPEMRKNRLIAWLQETGSFLQVLHGLPLRVPRSARDGQVSLVHHAWRPHGLAHPGIGTWVELMDVCDLHSFLQKHASDTVHPRYSSIDGIRSALPRLETMVTLDGVGSLFRPREQNLFAVVRLQDLALRSLGCVLDSIAADARLAELLRHGRDPIREAATCLQRYTDETAFFAGRGLRFDWPRLARILIELVSTGHSSVAIRTRLEVDGMFLQVREVDELVGRLTRCIFPELAEYLRCQVLDRMASKMRMTVADFARLWTERNKSEADPGTIGRSFFRNSPHRHPNEAIRELFRQSDDWDDLVVLANELPLDQFFEALTAQDFVSPTGRVFGGAAICDTFGKAHVLLAEAIRKKAIYALVRAGFAVCALVGDTLLVEVSSVDSEKTKVRIEEVLGPVFGEMLGVIPMGIAVQLTDGFEL